jgi:hypothetical protein
MMDTFLGHWEPKNGLLVRAWVHLLGLILSGSHVWVRYRRGMTFRRGRCIRCGVTADWDEDRLRLPRTCAETKKFLVVYEVMSR